jgi:hypothetical protein
MKLGAEDLTITQLPTGTAILVILWLAISTEIGMVSPLFCTLSSPFWLLNLPILHYNMKIQNDVAHICIYPHFSAFSSG